MSQIFSLLHAPTDHYQGEVDPRFDDLAALFSRMQSSRANQGGAALVVYFQQQKVVDIYVGQKSATETWQPNTLSMCYSTGKGVLATLAHVLVSQGILDYDVPVAQYWPEFAQNNKQQITLRHILSHQSGLFDIRNIIETASEMADWSHMLNVLEQATPRFKAGGDAAYQPLSYGWQLGGVLEKATGQSLADLMQQYLVQPLELDGAYFGVPKQQLANVAIPFNSAARQSAQPAQAKTKAKKKSLFDQAIAWSGQNSQDFQDAMIPKGMKHFSFYSDIGLQAVIPAANGVFTANSLAKIYAMLANKGVWNHQQMIQATTFEKLRQVQYSKRDRVMPIPMQWRLGYHRILTLGKATKGFGHIGFNGSGAWCDPERGLSFAYTHSFPTTSITGDYRLWGLSQEALRCADALIKGKKGWF